MNAETLFVALIWPATAFLIVWMVTDCIEKCISLIYEQDDET